MKINCSNPGSRRPDFGLVRRIFGRSTFKTVRAAFTRLELLAVLLALGLWTLWAWPVLAQTKPRSERLQCLGNLRLIGLAFQLWGNDHDDYVPWRVPQQEGGTLPASGLKPGAAWYEFAWVSNQLQTPKILVCPSDTGTRRVAKDFSNRPESGFLHSNYRANAVSYFVGLDVWPELARAVLSGDQNLRVDSVANTCSARVNNAATIRVLPAASTLAEWTNSIHRSTGNLLLNDGQVWETDTLVMRQAMQTGDDNGSVHLLMPK
jgi:hypothetical protein